MIDADAILYLRAGEALSRRIDARPYLLSGQYVTAATVTHEPPGGDPDTVTATPVTIAPAVGAEWVDVASIGPFAALGWHLVDVLLTFTGGATKAFRYRAFYGG